MKKAVLCALLISLLIPLSALAGKKQACVKHVQKPDLVLTDVKVEAADDNNVKITYTVKNQGLATSRPSTTHFQMLSAQAKESIKNAVPSLPPNRSYTAQINYNLASKGRYNLKATADYNNKITEIDETNNFNTLSFSVGIGLKK